MNRDCFGKNFKINGCWYWRCLGDGTITAITPENMKGVCPACGRPAEPDIVAVETRVVVAQEVRPIGSKVWLDFKKEIY